MVFTMFLMRLHSQPLGKMMKGWAETFSCCQIRALSAPRDPGEEVVSVPECFSGKQKRLGSCSCPRLGGALQGDPVAGWGLGGGRISHISGLSDI